MSLRVSSDWTNRKNKEQVSKAKNKTKLKPLYPRLYSDSYLEKQKSRRQHDKFCWRVGFAIMSVVTGLLIWGIVGLT